MKPRVGDKVMFRGKVYEVTAVRIGRYAHEEGPECEYNPRLRLPDYVELDHDAQVHPSKIEVVK